MRSDADFDGIATTFDQDIYESSKGHIRLNVLWEDMVSEIPRLNRGKLHVLDAGGGAGRMAIRLATLGNQVVLCDPSREMLDMAASRIRQEDLQGLVRLVQSTIQDLGDVITDRFDVITCHAVLEWLGDPEATLGQLTNFLTPKGHLSLMFYNKNAALFKRVIRGDFAGALHDYKRRPPPANVLVPLDEKAVREWLRQFGMTVVSKAGIRIFHDHLAGDLDQEGLEALLKLEIEMRRQEPFASIGQHIHLVCERATRE